MSEEYPPHVTDARDEWRKLSASRLAAWADLSDDQRQRFARVIGVATAPAEGERDRLREANDNIRAELRTHIEAIMKLNDQLAGRDRPAAQWAVIEVMGHRVIIGHVRECTVADAPMLHVERPDGITQLVPPQSVFCITDVTEDVARKAHEAESRQFYGPYGLPNALAAALAPERPAMATAADRDPWAGNDDEDDDDA